jgi:transcriptional regulator with XRE-family HTH domain
MNLIERLELVLSETGVDQSELGRAMGVTKGAVSQLLKGEIKSLKLEYAVGIQERFGYSAVWLVLGKGPVRTEQSTKLSPEMAQVFAVLAEIDAKGGEEREDALYFLNRLLNRGVNIMHKQA